MWEEFKVNVVEVNIVEPIILILPFVVVTNQLCLSCVGGDGKQYLKLICKEMRVFKFKYNNPQYEVEDPWLETDDRSKEALLILT